MHVSAAGGHLLTVGGASVVYNSLQRVASFLVCYQLRLKE